MQASRLFRLRTTIANQWRSSIATEPRLLIFSILRDPSFHHQPNRRSSQFSEANPNTQSSISSTLRRFHLPLGLTKTRFPLLINLEAQPGGLQAFLAALKELGVKPVLIKLLLFHAPAENLISVKQIADCFDVLRLSGIEDPSRCLKHCPRVAFLSHDDLADRLNQLIVLLYRREVAHVVSHHPGILLHTSDQVTELWLYMTEQMAVEPRFAARSRVWRHCDLTAVRQRHMTLLKTGGYSAGNSQLVRWVLCGEETGSGGTTIPDDSLSAEETVVLARMRSTILDEN